MIRFALKFCAGLLAAAAAACIAAPEAAEPPPAPPPVVTAPHVGGGQRVGPVPQECQDLGIISGRKFIEIKVRNGAFDPLTNLGAVPFFTMTPANPDAPGYGDVAAAFEAAPQSFQKQLCQLTGVIVNGMNCVAWGSNCKADPYATSWGLREKKERNSDPAKFGRYIAISYALWQKIQPLTLSNFQNGLLDSLLTGWTNTQTKPSITNGSGGSDDTAAMALLAVMAHEFGHVLWYDTMNLDRDPNYQVNKNWCENTDFFFKGGWSGYDLKPPMWRNFAGNDLGNTYGGSWFAEMRQYIGKSEWNNAIFNLNAIYGNNPQAYPSLFGAYSPDEDFVETFTLYVLLNAQNGHQLPNLKLHIPGHSDIDIKARGSQGTLARKIACFNPPNPPR